MGYFSRPNKHTNLSFILSKLMSDAAGFEPWISGSFDLSALPLCYHLRQTLYYTTQLSAISLCYCNWPNKHTNLSFTFSKQVPAAAGIETWISGSFEFSALPLCYHRMPAEILTDFYHIFRTTCFRKVPFPAPTVTATPSKRSTGSTPAGTPAPPTTASASPRRLTSICKSYVS